VSGGGHEYDGFPATGTWGFNVNLQNGEISNGFLNFYAAAFAEGGNFANGIGTATSSGFSFDAPGTFYTSTNTFSDTATVHNTPWLPPVDLLNAPPGTHVDMRFTLTVTSDDGIGTGTFTK